MIRKPVVSSNLRSVGYDPNEKRLEVEFHNGDVWSYHNVDAREHHGLMSADSIGSHFHAHIKHRHKATKH